MFDLLQIGTYINTYIACTIKIDNNDCYIFIPVHYLLTAYSVNKHLL